MAGNHAGQKLKKGNIMTSAKFVAAIDQCESRINAGNLTSQEMANAMIHLDRLASCFGKSSQEFRTWHFLPGGDKTEFDPVTHEQFAKYIAHKREMIAAHPYVATR